MKLSQGRAEAVVSALTSRHGIAAARLRACGVGPLAPVAPNSINPCEGGSGQALSKVERFTASAKLGGN